VIPPGVASDKVRQLRAICDDEVRERPAGGVYVSPASAEEVAAVLAFADQHQLTVGPQGGSTERSAGELRTDIVIHTSRLTEVEHYDHADLTVGVGAGTTIAQLNEMVGADRLMFGGDPPLPERCTVGGLLATGLHGPLRHGYGGVRDYCIGIRFVTGDGRRAKGGGRVVKNVAGYDLMKLLIGSYGTLAVITSASFKLFPAPRQTRSFLAEFRTAHDALEFRNRVMNSPLSPMCLELVSPRARKLMRPEMSEDGWVVCLRAAGSETVLARYRTELGDTVAREVEGEAERNMWCAIENFGRTAADAGAELIYMSVWPREIAAAIDTALSTTADGVDVSLIGRVGTGQFLIRFGGPDAVRGRDRAIHEIHARFGSQAAMKVVGAANPWPIRPENFEQMRAVKMALDPNNTLRGR
jgi:glycolate oxidase FAD binding subunit